MKCPLAAHISLASMNIKTQQKQLTLHCTHHISTNVSPFFFYSEATATFSLDLPHWFGSSLCTPTSPHDADRTVAWMDVHHTLTQNKTFKEKKYRACVHCHK